MDVYQLLLLMLEQTRVMTNTILIANKIVITNLTEN